MSKLTIEHARKAKEAADRAQRRVDTLETLWREIAVEVAKATEKFPTWPDDPNHAASVVAEEAGELVKATLERTYEPHKTTTDDVRKEAIQTAAMALRFLRSLEYYEFKPCKQHTQD